jgi:hypothetical protein
MIRIPVCVFYVSFPENLCFSWRKRRFSLREPYVSAQGNIEHVRRYADYFKCGIKNMHCFTLFLCWGVGVSGNYATFATYRVLTFNKHIYGSQEIAESGPRG